MARKILTRYEKLRILSNFQKALEANKKLTMKERARRFSKASKKLNIKL